MTDSILPIETLYEMGRTAAQNIDTGRYTIGDLCNLIETHYRGHEVEEFARQINVPFKRVYEYKRVCDFYEPSARAEYLEANPSITYSHLRLAMKFKDYDQAMDFLDDASAGAWTVDQAIREYTERVGKRVPPTRAVDVDAVICGRNTDPNVISIKFPQTEADKLARMAVTGQAQVRIVVFVEQVQKVVA